MRGATVHAIKISDHYDIISFFMHQLHRNEHELWDKTANWPEIEKQYMSHVLEMENENDGLCLIASVDNIPAGFIFGYTDEQDESRFEVYEGKELYVSDGYVDVAFRRQGIYKLLNDELEKHFIKKGVKRITRFTHLKNTGMRNFLEKSGYQPTRMLYEKWL